MTHVVISHPQGNENVRQACAALAQAGKLDSFWTALDWDPRGNLHRMVPKPIARQLARRSLAPEVRPYARLHPWRELARLAWVQVASSARPPKLLSPDSCAEALDRRVARYLASQRAKGVRAVYAYDHGALESFRIAKRNGQDRIYELPIGYWRAHGAVLAEEAKRWPDWHDASATEEFHADRFSRKDEEIALADRINVPSSFVKRTLEAFFNSLPPISVTPYGAPTAEPLGQAELERSATGPLRALYAGALGLRKGAPYLFEAFEHFGARIVTTVIGRKSSTSAALDAALARCNWIESLPRAQVLAHMRQSDIFVFPTLFEGMALVVLEAMSQGCAVITTPSSGAEDLIEHGVNGFLVPERSGGAIIEVIERLDADRLALQRVRQAASRSVALRGWSQYRTALAGMFE